MKILYVLPTFPVASETFVAAEVHGMRRLGLEVVVIASKRPTAAQTESMGPDMRELIATTYYPSRRELVTRACQQLTKLPRALSSIFALGKSSKNRARKSLQLIRALSVADYALELNVDHIHAHWPRPSEWAFLAHKLTHLPFSMSVHAHEVAHDNAHFKTVLPAAEFAVFCNRAAMNYLKERVPPRYARRSAISTITALTSSDSSTASYRMNLQKNHFVLSAQADSRPQKDLRD